MVLNYIWYHNNFNYYFKIKILSLFICNYMLEVRYLSFMEFELREIRASMYIEQMKDGAL